MSNERERDARVEAVARAICAACEENPDHKGDAQGNDFRWQDYMGAAVAALAATDAVGAATGLPPGVPELSLPNPDYWSTRDDDTPLFTADQMRAAYAEGAQRGYEAAQRWLPIEAAPEDGTFLVYMPNEPTKFQVARYHPNVKVIGGRFAFDLTKPTHYMPLPTPPKEQA